jgi:hypothetical protein
MSPDEGIKEHTWVLMHWTFVRLIVFQGRIWRCSFVPANDLADSQVRKPARGILWRSCIGLLLEPITSPAARCGAVPWQRCIWTFVQPNRTFLGRRAQVKTLNFYIAPRPSPSQYNRGSLRELREHDQSNTAHLFNVFRMEDVRFQTGLPVALHLSDTLDRNSSKPHSLAKKNWDDLKPTIRELYLNQRQTLKQLAKYLEEHYRFRPT